MDELIHQLTKIGFGESEGKCYLALLQFGSATVRQVSLTTGLSRSTVHRKFEDLMRKGVIMKQGEGEDEQRFIAEPPERLQSLIHHQIQELESRRRMVDRILGRLRAMHNTASARPKVRYIETIEGLRMVQRQFEEMKDDMIQLVGYDTFLELHQAPYADEHQGELAQSVRKIRSILITDKDISFPSTLNIEYVILSPESMPATGEMSVCGNRLLLFSYISGLAAVEITSASIAETARLTLELAWQRAKELGEYKKNRPS